MPAWSLGLIDKGMGEFLVIQILRLVLLLSGPRSPCVPRTLR